MAKEIVTHSWCDLCLADDVREPGAELVAQVGAGTKLLTVDLCAAHRKELADPLAELLAEHGRVAGAPTPTPRAVPGPHYRKQGGKAIPGPFVCQVPGCTQQRPFASASSLSWHVRNSHDPMSFAEYREQYGLVRAELSPDERAAFSARVARRKNSVVRATGPLTSDELEAADADAFGDDEHVDMLDLGVDRAELARKRRAAVGLDPSLAPDDTLMTERTFKCPECDVSYPSDKYARPSQALGVHRAMKHGVRSPKAHSNGPKLESDVE